MAGLASNCKVAVKLWNALCTLENIEKDSIVVLLCVMSGDNSHGNDLIFQGVNIRINEIR